jgi:hypothetical protein
MEINDGISDLMVARRLINHAQRMEDQRNGKKVNEKSIREEMEEDQFLLSGGEPAENTYGPASSQPVDDTQIRLSELSSRGQAAGENAQASSTQTVQVQYQQVIERSASIRYQALERVDGLVRRSQSLAETDRYRFDFMDGSTFKITDKWANRSTTIWGDPHVDVDDVEGSSDGDFQDLKTSDMHTTFMLQDGTQVTFTAQDSSIIEAVDIFKGNQHLKGFGEASSQWKENINQFSTPVEEGDSSSTLPKGDIVYAGGDGNDWFASGGTLVWGKTTGAVINGRPLATLQLEYHQSISQQLNLTVVNKQA